MVQASAQAQIYRARPGKGGGRHPEHRVGDMVDYHRPLASKDESGWHGPVPVTAIGAPAGIVICRIAGQARLCGFADVRLSLLVPRVFFDEVADTSSSSGIWPGVKTAISSLPVGVSKLYGPICNDKRGGW